nr:hypothetical protein Iba_scaffold13654CG0060 [Ipomoea batatas]
MSCSPKLRIEIWSAETRGPPVRGGVAIEQRGSPGRGGVAVHQKPEGRGGVGRSGEAEAVGRSRSASAASWRREKLMRKKAKRI